MATITGTIGTDSLVGGAGDDLFLPLGTNLSGTSDTVSGGDGADTYDLSPTPGLTNSFIVDDQGTDGAIDAIIGLGALHQSDGASYDAWASVRRVGTDLILDTPLLPGTPGVAAAHVQIVDHFGAGRIETLTAGGLQFRLATGPVGSALDDLMAGSDLADVLFAGDGDDWLFGNGGDDMLYGGAGSDVIRAGWGADFIDGGAGSDQLFGEAGLDRINGGAGDDTLTGGDERDTIHGDAGNDSITGDQGNDQLFGDGGRDVMTGGAGNDVMRGGWGIDLMDGGIGDDLMFGGVGRDSLLGDDGNDTIDGGSERDTITAGAGDDLLTGGTGGDRLHGEAGRDILIGGLGNDTLTGGADGDFYRFDVNQPFGHDTVRDRGTAVIAGNGDELDVTGLYDAGIAAEDAFARVSFARSGARMEVTFDSGASHITVAGMFGANYNAGFIETFEFDAVAVPSLYFQFLSAEIGAIGSERTYSHDVAGLTSWANEVIFGSAADEFIYAGGGTNFIWTGAGNDVLILDHADPDAGIGTLREGKGGGMVRNIVEDFDIARDKLDYSAVAGVGSLADIVIGQDADGDATLWWAAPDSSIADIFIELRGVAMADITADLFIFA